MKRITSFVLAASLSAALLPTPTQSQNRPAPVPAAGSPAGRVVPIQVLGDPATRFSLVLLGDGYTAAEMPEFRAHVEKHLNILWSLEPFRSYRNYINVYAVEVVSLQSGITCDPAHREQRTTALGLYFDGGCTDPNSRGILANQAAARAHAALATPAYDQILVIANSATYGGIGGSIATTSGSNTLSPYITPHELGHSLGRLQDEYTYSERGVKGPAYAGTEPPSVQHTILSGAEMRAQQKKWWRWLGEESESGGKIGLYEGGQSRVSGIWRPSKHSMIISLGYYFDQVSRERLTQRISEQVELIAASTPTDSAVARNAVLWIETAHPVYHELDVTWSVNGREVEAAKNSRSLRLWSARPAGEEMHAVMVRVVDPTSFVRDPVIRDTSFTATRTWKVGTQTLPVPISPGGRFTASTQTVRAVSGSEVIYVETSHPPTDPLIVSWTVDGGTVANPSNSRTLDLAELRLSPGTHTVSAHVSSHSVEAGATERQWTVDNTLPTVAYRLTGVTDSITDADLVRHYTAIDSFTMKLLPRDDMPGYVVAEFRVNGDGWHHYYGWPDAAADEPFHFTARGTTIKELVYGSLSAEGLSPQPWEPRLPGWGTHTIEYRARDAAGNIGETQRFRVTLKPSGR